LADREPRLSKASRELDPFDRLLLGVAVAEGLHLLTADMTLVALADRHPHLPIREA
jgi:hypothetical protein